MGKLAPDELRKLLTCIKKDTRVLVPPQVGYDAGVHRLGDKYVAVATDPCVGVPKEWFGFLLINYSASDVALFGAKPEFCTITLIGPRRTPPQEFQELMQQTCQAANELDIAIVRGHTATYDGICELIGVCTTYGTVEPELLITPANAKPDDPIICTKPIGLETATNYALTHKQAAEKLFGKMQAQKLARQVRMQSCVQEALKLAQVKGVHAMHDATEGGLVSALNELSDASGLGFEVDFERVPFPPEVLLLQGQFGFSDEQTMALSSTGTIIAAVDPKAQTQATETLSEFGLQADVIGKFTTNKRRTLLKKGKKTKFPALSEDPYAKIMAIKP
jgi:hydrogenase maturation factor